MQSLQQWDGIMKHDYLIMLVCQNVSEVVRVLIVRALAEIARTTDDVPLKIAAVSSLVDRRFLATGQPSDDDLWQIENMTDIDIQEVLRQSLH
jgi:hypothetical protein